VTAVGPAANATIQQHLATLRLFYDYLVEERRCTRNPFRRGEGAWARPPIQREHKLPWIPNEEEWRRFLAAASQERVGNKAMLATSYDAGLRREELCLLETGDIDPSRRTLRVRAETAKNRRERVVPYSATTGELFGVYLDHRRTPTRERGPLFLSESRRNRCAPVSIWTWSKVVAGIARRAGVNGFSPHTLRHLCLTDLARADWDIYEIATFAGHRHKETTTIYVHLSARDLAPKFTAVMDQLHERRLEPMGRLLRRLVRSPPGRGRLRPIIMTGRLRSAPLSVRSCRSNCRGESSTVERDNRTWLSSIGLCGRSTMPSTTSPFAEPNGKLCWCFCSKKWDGARRAFGGGPTATGFK
jgi:integrase